MLQISNEMGIKACLCGHQFQVDPGAVDYGYKDELGKQISDDAAVHMSINRVKCPECEKVFCSGCQAQPYHLGKSCEENAAYRAALKCRYCQAALKNGPCEEPECLELGALSCQKKLDCGHECYGCFDEDMCMPCLHEDCIAPNAIMNEDDFCGICFTTAVK